MRNTAISDHNEMIANNPKDNSTVIHLITCIYRDAGDFSIFA